MSVTNPVKDPQPHAYQTFVWTGWVQEHEDEMPQEAIEVLAVGDVRIPVSLREMGCDYPLKFVATTNIAEHLGECSGVAYLYDVPMEVTIVSNGALILLVDEDGSSREYVLRN